MTRRLRNSTLAAIVLVVLVASLGVSAKPAHAAKGMEVGLVDDPAFVSERGLKRKPALKLADRLYTTWLRVNIPWNKVVRSPKKKKRPKHPKYDFTSYDVLFNNARTHGIKLQLTISGFAPAWATGNHKIGCYKINVKYFNGYVRALVKHFKGNIERYSIWNEPNYVSWNGPLSQGPKRYRQMYKAGYKTIKGIDHHAKVFIGETSPYGQSGRATAPMKFMRSVLKGEHLKADGYAHHPYDFRHGIDYRYPGKDNATIKTLKNLTRQLDKFGHSGQLTTPSGKRLDVYLTEYGYMGSGKYKVPEKKRAKYLTKAFQIALDNSRVKEMIHYLLVKPPHTGLFFDTSIVKKGGKRTKSFNALAGWAHKQAKAKRIELPDPPAPGYQGPKR
jgi:GH35 family endo-1,4-beta-xylanase